MKTGRPMTLLLFLMAAVLLCAGEYWRAQAAPPPPVRLAIVSEGDGLAPTADLLTAELSKDARLALLERDQIAQVLKEQALAQTSGGKKDFLKVGRLLSADGLLLIETT